MIDLVAINATTLRISWEEPLTEEQNGIITNYVIKMTTVETGEQSQFTQTRNTIELNNLHPYYTFTFIIAAATVNGTGPYSGAFSIQLPPDGE